MDYRVNWTVSAIGDLRGIVRYIAMDDPSTARRFGDHGIPERPEKG